MGQRISKFHSVVQAVPTIALTDCLLEETSISLSFSAVLLYICVLRIYHLVQFTLLIFF